VADALPSLTALRAFEAAARHGSFTLAARELSVTQGAVSQQVRRLEEELGYALFRRVSRKVVLTDEGERLAASTTSALETIAHALRHNRRHLGDHLTVSVPASFAMKWLVPRLELFARERPDIEVRISATNRMVDLTREGIDLCVRFGPGPYRGFDCELLVTEDILVVCSPHLLGRPPALRELSDLRNHTLIHDVVLEQDPDRMSWPRYLALAGVEMDAEAGPRFSHSAMAIAAAVAGQGVALGRSCLVADDLASRRLVRATGPIVPSPFSYWLIAPAGGLSRPRVAAFTAWMRRSIAGSTAT